MTALDDDTTPDAGVDFPLVDGRRSTSATSRAVLADALRGTDPDLAREIGGIADWRSGYLAAYRALTVAESASATAAAAVSGAGLDAVHRRFVTVRSEGERPALDEAARGAEPGRTPGLHRVTVDGTGVRPDRLDVPYGGERLADDDLRRLLDRWAAAGTVEPSFVTALGGLVDDPAGLDVRDLTVVVLGAGAQLAPLVSLLRWGAHVVAVDVPRFELWRDLLAVARRSAGRLTVPVRRWLPPDVGDDAVAAAAGVDMLVGTGDVVQWLLDLPGPFTLGTYVYLDGARHVRVGVAVDAVTQVLAQARPDVSLAFLATPTDVFRVPDDAVRESRQRYDDRSWLRRLARHASAGRLLQPNYPDPATSPGPAHNDSLVPQQGPNYALAKRIQRWRAVHEAAAGRLVSINVAPATRTRSVLRNRLLAAAYAGAHRFGVEVFEPATSSTVMAALLVHDLRAGVPAGPVDPAGLLAHGAAHGGLWRIAYAPRSALGLAVVTGAVSRS